MELVTTTFPPPFSKELYPVVERLQSLLGDINDEANFICSIGRRLTNEAKLSDVDGLKHRMAQEQHTLDELERGFSHWWTADRRCGPTTRVRRRHLPQRRLNFISNRKRSAATAVRDSGVE